MQGTLDLLRARGLTKSEMRADVTMIMAQDNNPLKFSPTVEAALTHLLAPQVHGFMPPLRAMKDAYDDLRAHQLGFLAGMRAALEEGVAQAQIARTHHLPKSTVQRWITRYREQGLAGLANTTHSDKGKSRRLPQTAIQLIEGLALSAS